jgi:hypothetical protein
LENLKRRARSKDLGVEWMINEQILGKQGEEVWIEFIWLRTETSEGLV